MRSSSKKTRFLALATAVAVAVGTISLVSSQNFVSSGYDASGESDPIKRFNMNQASTAFETSRIPLHLRGGGQVASCVNPRMTEHSTPSEEEPSMAPKLDPPTAKGVGFFPEIGKVANSLLKFGGVGVSKMNLTAKTEQKGLKFTGLAMPSYPQESSVLKIKGEGKQGNIGYWIGADVQNKKIEGGLAAKKSLGEGRQLDLYLTSVIPRPQSIEAEAKYTDTKLKASIRAPTVSTKSSGPLEGSMAVQFNDNFKFVGAGVVNPEELSLEYLKKSSALGAQYRVNDYTISAQTEGFGKQTKATISTKVGDEELALAATMSNMGRNPNLHAGIKTQAPYGVTAKAAISTNGDFDLELSRKLVDRLSLRVGAKTNMNNLSQKPKFGAQLNIDAGF